MALTAPAFDALVKLSRHKPRASNRKPPDASNDHNLGNKTSLSTMLRRFESSTSLWQICSYVSDCVYGQPQRRTIRSKDARRSFQSRFSHWHGQPLSAAYYIAVLPHVFKLSLPSPPTTTSSTWCSLPHWQLSLS